MDYNPFGIVEPKKSEVYLALYKNALKLDHSNFFKQVDKDFDFKNATIKQFIDNIAKIAQVVIKKSVLMWLHGYLLYVALSDYLKNPTIDFVNILETGTARGFSSLCMAKALHDNNRKGKIHTVDTLRHDAKMYWNCMKDEEGKHTRQELFKGEPCYDLFKYIKFHTGASLDVLNSIKLDRIHFAFLDAQHDYVNLNHELVYVKNRQKNRDVIVCDDYTTYNTGHLQFPGINKAIDEFKDYTKKVYYGEDGEKKRGYVYLQKCDKLTVIEKKVSVTNSIKKEIKNVMIIPYRDRKTQLDLFYQEHFPRLKQYLNNVEILIVEQDKGKPFNRGKVLNIGVKESDYNSNLFTHDVDVHPHRHTIYRIYNQNVEDKEIKGIYTSKHNTLGGIIKFNKKTFETINGFPNEFWGWGMEDKALQNRAEFMKIKVTKNILQDTLHENDYFRVNDKNVPKVITEDAQKKHNYVYDEFPKFNETQKYKHTFEDGINNLKYTILNDEILMENVRKITVKI